MLGAAGSSKQYDQLQRAEYRVFGFGKIGFGQPPCQPPLPMPSSKQCTLWDTPLCKPKAYSGSFHVFGGSFSFSSSLHAAFRPDGLGIENCTPCLCMAVFALRAAVSHAVLNSKPASVPDTLAAFFFFLNAC